MSWEVYLGLTTAWINVWNVDTALYNIDRCFFYGNVTVYAWLKFTYAIFLRASRNYFYFDVLAIPVRGDL